jgi:hypothetical protein
MRLRKIQLLNDWAIRDFKICLQKSKMLPAFASEFIDALMANVAATGVRRKPRLLMKSRA